MKFGVRKKAIAAGAVVLVAGLGATGAVAAAPEPDNDEPIAGEALETATRVALEHLGEGRVTATEIGDEDSYYEVEVTLADGSEVDVQLNEDFEVAGTELEQLDEPDSDNDD